jgi:hypothetical protein
MRSAIPAFLERHAFMTAKPRLSHDGYGLPVGSETSAASLPPDGLLLRCMSLFLARCDRYCAATKCRLLGQEWK